MNYHDTDTMRTALAPSPGTSQTATTPTTGAGDVKRLVIADILTRAQAEGRLPRASGMRRGGEP